MSLKIKKIVTTVIGIAVVFLLVLIVGPLVIFHLAAASDKKQVANVDFMNIEWTGIDQDSMLTSQDLKDNQLGFINLWQTTCSGCIEEMPVLEYLSKEYQGQVLFVGVCTDTVSNGKLDDTKLEEAKRIVDLQKLTYAEMLPSEKLSGMIENIAVYPLTFIVDSEGQVLETITGSQSKSKWKQLIDRHLEQVK